MDSSEFRRIFKECMIENGFAFRNNKCYLLSEKLIAIIQTQKSNFSNGFYINYGFLVKEIHKNMDCSNICLCDVVGRFTINDKDEYELSSLTSEMLIESLKTNVNDIIFPVANGGIMKYFELYPKAICVAKKELREFLNSKYYKFVRLESMMG